MHACKRSRGIFVPVEKKVPHLIIFWSIYAYELPSDFLKTHLTKLTKFNPGDLGCTRVCEIMHGTCNVCY